MARVASPPMLSKYTCRFHVVDSTRRKAPKGLGDWHLVVIERLVVAAGLHHLKLGGRARRANDLAAGALGEKGDALPDGARAAAYVDGLARAWLEDLMQPLDCLLPPQRQRAATTRLMPKMHEPSATPPRRSADAVALS